MIDSNASGLPTTLDTSFITNKRWRRLIVEEAADGRVMRIDRKHFELYLLSRLVKELKAGNLWVEGSEKYGNFYDHWISDEEWLKHADQYIAELGWPKDPEMFWEQWVTRLRAKWEKVNTRLPQNKEVRLCASRQGKNYISLPSLERAPTPEKEVARLKDLLGEHIDTGRIIDILIEVDNEIGFTAELRRTTFAGSNSRKLRRLKYATAVAYGCNIGPNR